MRAARLLSFFLLLTAAKPDVQVSSLEKRILEQVNAERQKAGLKPLLADPKLVEIARSHSKDMANRHYMAHVNPDGLAPTDRARTAGYVCRETAGRYTYSGIAENIYQNNLYRRAITTGAQTVYEWNTENMIATTSVTGWMQSSGHRANILGSHYAKTGVGVAVSSDQKVYITQDFC